jgi:hypothetical protein
LRLRLSRFDDAGLNGLVQCFGQRAAKFMHGTELARRGGWNGNDDVELTHFGMRGKQFAGVLDEGGKGGCI